MIGHLYYSWNAVLKDLASWFITTLTILAFQRSEEERRKAAEEERLQLEAEEKKAWEALQLAQERKAELSQILETEQAEAKRKAEELKQQAEREEMEKIEEGERWDCYPKTWEALITYCKSITTWYNDKTNVLLFCFFSLKHLQCNFDLFRLINQAKLTALIQEQERLIIEEHLEEVQQQKQEQEATDITQLSADEPKDLNCAEDPADQEMTDQEREEKLYDVTTDDETRVSIYL